MSLDAEIVFYLNSFTGKSVLVDNFVFFCASILPWILVLLILFWLWRSQNSKKKKIYIFLVTTSAALVTRFAVTEVIRFMYHRPRPYIEYSEIHALFEVNQWSFPSGHASFFFAIATTLFLFDKKIGSVIFLLTAIMTACRVIAGVHYPSDIIAGMFLGIGVANLAFYLAQNKFKSALSDVEVVQ